MEKDKRTTPVEDSKICERVELSDEDFGQVNGGGESEKPVKAQHDSKLVLAELFASTKDDFE